MCVAKFEPPEVTFHSVKDDERRFAAGRKATQLLGYVCRYMTSVPLREEASRLVKAYRHPDAPGTAKLPSSGNTRGKATGGQT